MKLNKRKILNALVSSQGRRDKLFWGKEFKLLSTILEQFPEPCFWLKVQSNIILFDKVPSLAIHISENNKRIKDRYDSYFYEPPFKNPDYNIGEKAGEDTIISKKKNTIKEFLS